MSSESETFETHDLNLAAYLKLSGCKMENKYRQGSRVFFVFSNVGGSIKDLREAFFSNKGMVPAKAYSEEIKNMKQL